MSGGVNVLLRAAASSMASGRPSRRTQILATAGASAAVNWKPAATARERSTKSATEGTCANASGGSW
jgi:hypothetical protein